MWETGRTDRPLAYARSYQTDGARSISERPERGGMRRPRPTSDLARLERTLG